MISTETDATDLVRLIRADYEEMPGLALTCAQIRRMWAIDAETCKRTMQRLVAAGILARGSDGAFRLTRQFHGDDESGCIQG